MSGPATPMIQRPDGKPRESGPPRASGPRIVAAPLAGVALVVVLVAVALGILSYLALRGADVPILSKVVDPPVAASDEDPVSDSVLGTMPQFTAGAAYDSGRFTEEVRRTLEAAGAVPGTIACNTPGRLTAGSRIACTDVDAGVTDRLFVRITDVQGHFEVTWDVRGASGTERSSA